MTEFITTAQAAHILGIATASAQKYAARGLFPGAKRFGEGQTARWMIPLAAVLAYAARRRSPGRPRPPQEAGATETKGESDD